MKIKPYQIIGACFGLLAVGSLLAIDQKKELKTVIAVAWLVIPPIYFFFELHWGREHHPEQLENCKLSQESASKIWVGVAAALGLKTLGACRTSRRVPGIW